MTYIVLPLESLFLVLGKLESDYLMKKTLVHIFMSDILFAIVKQLNNSNIMNGTLYINRENFVKPLRASFKGDAESWSATYIYDAKQLNSAFTGYCVTSLIEEHFRGYSNGPGQAFSRDAILSLRCHGKFQVVQISGGLDV